MRVHDPVALSRSLRARAERRKARDRRLGQGSAPPLAAAGDPGSGDFGRLAEEGDAVALREASCGALRELPREPLQGRRRPDAEIARLASAEHTIAARREGDDRSVFSLIKDDGRFDLVDRPEADATVGPADRDR